MPTILFMHKTNATARVKSLRVLLLLALYIVEKTSTYSAKVK